MSSDSVTDSENPPDPAAELPWGQLAFRTSAARLGQLPADQGVEIALAGRSNAGKSSVLNRLASQRGLARTSKTPGRTQLLNVFEMPGGERVIDLPGYGFARVPDAVRDAWRRLIGSYLEQRASLAGLVIIMDIRHPLKEGDVELIDWCNGAGLPVHILLNKADKLKRGPARSQLLGVARELEQTGASASLQLFSALSGDGLADARAVIAELMAER
ncbi:MAG: YihA family ribosome biogenesis GTP-binding protein, partial [Gammaproteobacteria bacterium]|nr:YihA family ribosome biogenesis GTP-binding protein [Gammaproteobacteria bacterium]